MISRVAEALNKIRGSMGSHGCHILPDITGGDLLRFGKPPFCLFICTILAAMTVVITAYYTRLLAVQRGQLVLEQDVLDIEQCSLILEGNTLDSHSRVERIATEKLQVQHVDPS